MRTTTTYYIEIDSGLIIARRDSIAYVPVLQYDKIGENGNFTKPFEYKVEAFDVLAVLLSPGVKPISRNKIPQSVKDNFRKEIARLERAI